MTKKLPDLLKGLDYQLIQGNINQNISTVSYDSRKCTENSIFVAIAGLVADGHTFIPGALNFGAKVVVVSKDIVLPKDITIIKVEDTRKALALIGANFYDNPSEKIKVVGITGTNGKTTTIHILKSIYEKAGFKTGLIGTIGASVGEMTIPCKNTTPESLDLQHILFQMAQEGVEYCFMEVSSHALGLDRVFATKFYGAMYTNLSPDHMEFHKDMEDYYNTKKKLFFMSDKLNLINVDDPWGRRLFTELKDFEKNLITYSVEEDSDYKAFSIEYSVSGVKYEIKYSNTSGEITLNLPGRVNVYNSLIAAAFALNDNISFSDVSAGIKNVQGVKGRFETAFRKDDFQVIIDFAHTEDGLKEVITSLRPFTKGKIVLVFGVYAAPGKAGRDKRLAMGSTASEFADILFVTSDNPKTQDPGTIIEEIIEGIKSFNDKKEIYSFIDRREAIENAINIAGEKDLVLITGKGHETAQVIGNEAVPFNEKEIVLNAILKNKNKAGIK
jgi:UDP-N-acetylmuramoyl-L-alanyl-D-glutamate--2,6-diaminopimelate ligase